MSDGSFGAILASFKGNESADSIVCLIDDGRLRHGLSAWKSVKVEIVPKGECQEQSTLDKWNWLWDQTNVDLKTFGVVAGVQDYESKSLFMRLKGLRLIYPDGTVNRLAEQYLHTIVFNSMPKKRKQKQEG